MTLNELMHEVIEAYPDPDIIAAYWNPGTGKMNKKVRRDTYIEKSIDCIFGSNCHR